MTQLIMIPGVLCDERLFAAQITALGDVADIVVADITRQSSIPAMADAVLADAPERFCLAGFSLGSQVALQIMETAPERVERLALLSATHGGLLPTSAAAFQKALEPIEHGGFEAYLESLFPVYFTERDAQKPELKRIFMDMAHNVGQEAGLRQMRALLELREPFANLDRIRCQTVVIGGAEDHRTTFEAHEMLAREIPDAKLVKIAGSAHFTTLEQPEAVSAALRNWLTKTRDLSAMA
jgi:pimeloyl-ACP methyl ester carboxylesterase